MTYRGRVRNGVVVLEGRQTPPEGAEVSVRVLKVSRRSSRRTRAGAPPERFRNLIGIVKDLPADFSVNLDHYLYGAPKRT